VINVTGYDPAQWDRLFASAGGPAAALAGLIFVGLSVNITYVLEVDRRLGWDFLISRALEAFVTLLGTLMICLVGQTPHVPDDVLAIFILLMAVAVAVTPALALHHGGSWGRRSVFVLQRVVFALALAFCLLAAGVTLLIGHGGGLFWLPGAFVLAFSVAAANAWVLLVEIRRGASEHATPASKIARGSVPPWVKHDQPGPADDPGE
jgi:hypothetical protein